MTSYFSTVKKIRNNLISSERQLLPQNSSTPTNENFILDSCAPSVILYSQLHC